MGTGEGDGCGGEAVTGFRGTNATSEPLPPRL